MTKLTDRQIEIMHLKSMGCTMRDVGDILGISMRTVGGHLDIIRQKYGTHKTKEAVALFQKEYVR